MKNFVWADTDSNKLIPLMDTTRLHNIKPEIIGIGFKVKSDYFFKLSSLYEKLCNLDDDEVVCCTDGFDVLYQDNAESMQNKFLSFDCDIVFSAEKWYSHQYEKHRKYFDNLTNSPYKYLNSGCVVGYVKSLREVLKQVKPKENLFQDINDKILLAGSRIVKNELLRDIFRRVKGRSTSLISSGENISQGFLLDQTVIGNYIATNKDGLEIKLDYDCKLFWCVAGEWEEIDKHYKIIHNKIVNKNTNNAPSCIHVPYTDKYGQVFLKIYDLIMQNSEQFL